MKQLKAILSLTILLMSFNTFSQDKPMLVIDPKGHSARINDVMFTADGKTLISVSDDKTISVWNSTNGELRKTIRGEIGEGANGKLVAGAISPDGQLIAVAARRKISPIKARCCKRSFRNRYYGLSNT